MKKGDTRPKDEALFKLIKGCWCCKHVFGRRRVHHSSTCYQCRRCGEEEEMKPTTKPVKECKCMSTSMSYIIHSPGCPFRRQVSKRWKEAKEISNALLQGIKEAIS